jgi:hypothetical protein
MREWIELANSPVGQGIAWFLVFVGFGIGAHLYGINGWRRK